MKSEGSSWSLSMSGPERNVTAARASLTCRGSGITHVRKLESASSKFRWPVLEADKGQYDLWRPWAVSGFS